MKILLVALLLAFAVVYGQDRIKNWWRERRADTARLLIAAGADHNLAVDLGAMPPEEAAQIISVAGFWRRFWPTITDRAETDGKTAPELAVVMAWFIKHHIPANMPDLAEIILEVPADGIALVMAGLLRAGTHSEEQISEALAEMYDKELARAVQPRI